VRLGGDRRQAARPGTPGGPSGRTIVVVVLGLVATVAHLFIGVLPLLFIGLTADDPAGATTLNVWKALIAIAWIAFLVAIAWAVARRSLLVILIPVAAMAAIWLIASMAHAAVPSHLQIGY